MKIEESDEIVCPALFKCTETGKISVANRGHQVSCYLGAGKRHIGSLVEEIVYPAVFEDCDMQKFLFLSKRRGLSLDGRFTQTEHDNMTHLYNAKIERSD